MATVRDCHPFGTHQNRRGQIDFAMRMRGLEPPRPYGHTDLNRARLPIPPHPRGSNDSSSGSSHLSMTRLAAFAATALALLSLTLGVTSDDAAARTEVVVLLESRPLARDADAAATIEVQQRTFRRELARELPDARVGWSYRLVANGFSVSLPESEVPQLRALAGVRDVLAAGGYEPQLASTPEQIGARALWGATLDTAGQGVKIGIIDSGIDATHPFFDPTGYAMPQGFPKGQRAFTTAKVIVARVFAPAGTQLPSTKVPYDERDSSHGTHVAGIAAGNADTPTGQGRVSGVAPRAYLGNYKVFVETDAGVSPNANAPAIVAAIEAAVADGMDVINFSGGEPEIEPSRDVVALALDAAAAAGVVPVVAAGNDYSELGAGSVASPSNSARAISVGAVDVGGTPTKRVHAGFSSVGPTTISHRLKPDVAAPGVAVLSSVDGDWAALSGTSMAAPHVAGAAGLLVQRHPTWTPDQVRSALVQTGVDAVNTEGDVVGPQFQGGGVVGLGKADQPLVFARAELVVVRVVRRPRVGEEGKCHPRGCRRGFRYLECAAATAPAGAGRLARPRDVERERPRGARVRSSSRRSATCGRTLGLPRASSRSRGSPDSVLGPADRTGDRATAVHHAAARGCHPQHDHRPSQSRVPLPLPGEPTRGRSDDRPSRPRACVSAATDQARGESWCGDHATRPLEPCGAARRRRVRREPADRVRGAARQPQSVLARGSASRSSQQGRSPPRRASMRSSSTAPVAARPARSRSATGSTTSRLPPCDSAPEPSLVAARCSSRQPTPARASTPNRCSPPSTGTGWTQRSAAESSPSRPPGSSRACTACRVRISDYQESKNTENVARILPNTRWLTATFRVR